MSNLKHTKTKGKKDKCLITSCKGKNCKMDYCPCDCHKCKHEKQTYIHIMTTRGCWSYNECRDCKEKLPPCVELAESKDIEE